MSSKCLEMANYHLSTGGKRIRAKIPVLLITAFSEGQGISKDLFGGDFEKIGSAAELFHNATLVHDDLQDGDELRRGKPTVWKMYGAAQAINAGDAMFFFGLKELQNLELNHLPGNSGESVKAKLEIMGSAVRQVAAVIEGQSQEICLKNDSEINVQKYLNVARGKTSGLFIFPVEASLLALGSDQKLIESAARAALRLGELFQVKDDVIDLYGDKQRDRKGTDIAEGKISFLVAATYESGNKNQVQQLEEILRTPRESTTDAQILEALRIFEESGAKSRAFDFIESHSKKLLDDVAEYPWLKKSFINILELF